jgi:hydroxymethylpyrimidine pyrophosphatase-like HAD family hydrolase
MMHRYTIPRSGRAPLAFDGCLIAHDDGQTVNSQRQTRWHVIDIYQTSDGKYALVVEYHTTWKGEANHTDAGKYSTPEEVTRALEAYDPVKHVQGWPVGKTYEDRQKRLLAEVRSRFKAQVGSVLSSEDFAVSA